MPSAVFHDDVWLVVKQRVACSGAADDGIGRFTSVGALIVKRTIGSGAFETQAFRQFVGAQNAEAKDPSSHRRR